ncbi:hypothetical protein [Kitasatospora paranensis]|uniref:Uncharacterized protein n=1 Tax=Kitasatospora paranensis TaxID=258053 RepID=A0ABW2G1W0_9ACTN
MASGPSGRGPRGGILAEAAASTERAAAWVRRVAERQSEPEHAAVLERFACAVSRAGADLDPTDGYLGGVGWETRYRLDGYVLLGARRTQQPITLTPTETLTLGTIGALALALPAAAMFDPTDLARLCAVLDDAVTHARTHSPNPEPASTPPA